MKKFAPRTTRLAGVGAAAFVLALAAPAMASADEGDNTAPECKSTTLNFPDTHAAFNCTDKDGDTLTIQSVNKTNGGLGVAHVNGDNSVDILDVVPDASGQSTFTALVTDGKSEQPTEWYITLNYKAQVKAPVANGDSFSAKIGDTVSGNLTANDSNAEGATAELSAPPNQGDVTVAKNGSFTYKAVAEGTFSFMYKLTNEAGSSEAKVTITVSATGSGGGDNNGGGNNNGGNTGNNGGNNGGNTGNNAADKDKLAKTGTSLPVIAATGAAVLVAGAGAVWFTRRRRTEQAEA